MKKTLALSTILLSIFSFNSVFAQTSPTSLIPPTSHQGIDVATVSINNAKIVSQNKRDFVISFDLTNSVGAQPQVRYAVRLIQLTKGAPLADEKVYAEILSLSENTTVSKTIKYSIPNQLSASTYSLWIDVKNDNGLMFATAFLGQTKIIEDVPNTIEILPGSCYLITSAGQYLSDQSAFVGSSADTFTAKCTVKSNLSADIILAPHFITREHTVFGDIASSTGGSTGNLTIKSGINNISVELPKATKPQNYNLTFYLASADAKTVSNTTTFNYSLAGQSGTIKNVVFDKNFYKAGETANIQIFSTQTGTGTIIALVSNSSGDSCAATSSKQISSFSVINLSIPIIKDCTNPKASITIYDAKGNILDSKDFKVTTPSNSQLIIIVVIILIILALIFGYLIYKKKHSALKVFIFALLFSSAFFNFAKISSAASYVDFFSGLVYTNYDDNHFIDACDDGFTFLPGVPGNYTNCIYTPTGGFVSFLCDSSGSFANYAWSFDTYFNATPKGSINPWKACTPPVVIPASNPCDGYGTAWDGSKWVNNGCTGTRGTVGYCYDGWYYNGSTYTNTCTGTTATLTTGGIYTNTGCTSLPPAVPPYPCDGGGWSWNGSTWIYNSCTGTTGTIGACYAGWTYDIPAAGTTATYCFGYSGGKYTGCSNTTGVAGSLTCTSLSGSLYFGCASATAFSAPVITITADSNSVPINSSTNLHFSWTPKSPSTYTDPGTYISCILTGNGLTQAWTAVSGASSGILPTGNMSSSQTFSLTCTESNGTNSLATTKTVSVDPPAVNIDAASGKTVAAPVPYNSSTTISWTATNVASCLITKSVGGVVDTTWTKSFLGATAFSQIGTIPSAGWQGGKFNIPWGIAIDSSDPYNDIIYVADSGNNRIQIFSGGTFIKSLGYGCFNNSCSVGYHTNPNTSMAAGSGNGQFSNPTAVTLGTGRNIYVLDSGNNRVQVFNPAGGYIGQFGSGILHRPSGMTMDSGATRLFVTDGSTVSYGDRIMEFNADNYTFVRQIGSYGGYGTSAEFYSYPDGMAFDSFGKLWIAVRGKDAVQGWGPGTNNYFYLGYSGGPYTYPAGVRGSGNGQFMSPTAVAVDSANNIWVTDGSNSRVQKFNSAGTYLAQYGSYGSSTGQLFYPGGIEIDANDNIFIADTYNKRVVTFHSGDINGSADSGPIKATTVFTATCGSTVRTVTVYASPAPTPPKAASIVTISASSSSIISGASTTISWNATNVESCSITKTVSGTISPWKTNLLTDYLAFGTTSPGNLNHPRSIARDSSDNIYVADTNNDRVQKFNSAGTYITQFSGFSQTFNDPWGIAVDSANNIYVADTGNLKVQKRDSSGTHSSFSSFFPNLIGNLNIGPFTPTFIAVDSSGNIYVSDTQQNHIEKITPPSTYSSVGPTGSYIYGGGWTFPNYMGTSSGQFWRPSGIGIDSANNIYIADYGNNRVQKFDSSGNFVWWLGYDDTTNATTHITGAGAPGSGSGQFSGPTGVAIDSANNIYVADMGNSRIQKFSPSGSYISQYGSYGSGPRQFSYPYGVTVGINNSVYVADTNNSRAQKFSQDINGTDTSGALASTTIFTITCNDGPDTISASTTVSITISGSPTGSSPIFATTTIPTPKCQVRGWACDPDSYFTKLSVDLKNSSGTLVSTTTAALSSPTVVPSGACGGPITSANHGYALTVPSIYWDGITRTMSVTAYGVNTLGIKTPPNQVWTGIQVTCPIVPCTSFTTSPWGACSGSPGTQTRTVNYLPLGCFGGVSTSTNQSCTPGPAGDVSVISTCIASQAGSSGLVYINRPMTWTATFPSSSSPDSITGTVWNGRNNSGTETFSSTTPGSASLAHTYTTIGRKFINATTTGTTVVSGNTVGYTATCSTSTVLYAVPGTTEEF